MASRERAEVVRRREKVRDRVKFLLEYQWGGNQRQMARDLAVSQGLISKIVNGLQGPGSRFLATLARQPSVNADWILRGEGPPLSLPPRGTLPVALGVLPGPPLQYSHLVTGQRHPVAEVLDRSSRYWMELQSSSPLVRDPVLRLLPADLLLMETDSAWTSRLDLIEGRLCGVRLQCGLAEPAFALGKLSRDSLGLVFDTLDGAIRLDWQSSLPQPSTCSASPLPPPIPEAHQSKTAPSGRKKAGRRRTIRYLDREEEKAETRRRAEENDREERGSRHGEAAGVSGNGGDTITLQNVVGVCVYLARSSPGHRQDSPSSE
jgi:hypothetical protein